jgi:hypothetical protein
MNLKVPNAVACSGSAPCAPALISIVITCYNQAQYLGEAIESALAQGRSDNEVLVVDDGSTDGTAEVAGQYSQVHYIRQENRGLAAARNTGMRQSAGRYLIFLDADDRLTTHAVNAGLACFRKRPQAGFVYGRYQNIYRDGSPADTPSADRVERDYYWHLLRGNVIGMHATVMYARAALESAGGFDETLRACEDYELYLRMAQHWPVCRHDECIAEYRHHDANMSADPAFMLDSVLLVLKLERRRIPDSRHHLALRTGIRAWKDYYGSQLIERWKQRKTVSGLLRHLRRDPRGVLCRGLRFVAKRILHLRHERTLEPFSRRFGLDRGQPIDRCYIESFLAEHAACICGKVLEIGDDSYSRQFGGSRVTHQDVLHVVPGFPGATIIADLVDAPHLPSQTFDCIIFTQTLHYIFDAGAAVATLARILKNRGTLLLTVPGISPICRDQANREADCWRFTGSSVRKLLTRHFPGCSIDIRTFGNVRSATAFLEGRAMHELTRRELDHFDPDYPLIIAAAVRRKEP